MREINKLIFFIFLNLLPFSVSAENKILAIGETSAKITVKVFSL